MNRRRQAEEDFSESFTWETRRQWLESYISTHDVCELATQLLRFLKHDTYSLELSRSFHLQLETHTKALIKASACKDIVLLYPFTKKAIDTFVSKDSFYMLVNKIEHFQKVTVSKDTTAKKVLTEFLDVPHLCLRFLPRGFERYQDDLKLTEENLNGLMKFIHMPKASPSNK